MCHVCIHQRDLTLFPLGKSTCISKYVLILIKMNCNCVPELLKFVEDQSTWIRQWLGATRQHVVTWAIVSPDIRCHIEGILPKGPYLPCVSMAGRALSVGYPRYHVTKPPIIINWYIFGSISMYHYIEYYLFRILSIILLCIDGITG